MRVYIVAVFLFGSCACLDEKLVNSYTCENPKPETCNNIDDDCDGFTDEDLMEECGDSCSHGFKVCENGQMTQCVQPPKPPETCNGKDDDCDGKIDNIEVLACYPPNRSEDLLSGICRYGATRCAGKNIQCVGWVGPGEETCNNIDDDCDGSIDEGFKKDLDIVVVLDYSCSMYTVLPYIQDALVTWASNQPDSIQLALVGVPSPSNLYLPTADLMTDFLNPSNFISFLVSQSGMGGGVEVQVDALAMIANPSNPFLLNWRSNTHKIALVWTDEHPQTYTNPVTTRQDVELLAAQTNLHYYIFTSESQWADWSNLRPMTVGPSLIQELETIVNTYGCQP